eukprot:164918_1
MINILPIGRSLSPSTFIPCPRDKICLPCPQSFNTTVPSFHSPSLSPPVAPHLLPYPPFTLFSSFISISLSSLSPFTSTSYFTFIFTFTFISISTTTSTFSSSSCLISSPSARSAGSAASAASATSAPSPSSKNVHEKISA